MATQEEIQRFLNGSHFAVAGASENREKYGNIVFRRLLDSGRTVYPIHPSSHTIEGHTAYPSIADVPGDVDSLSIVTPPSVTRKVVEAAIKEGVKHFWMQPGAEDSVASEMARNAGATLIDDGSCILVLLSQE